MSFCRICLSAFSLLAELFCLAFRNVTMMWEGRVLRVVLIYSVISPHALMTTDLAVFPLCEPTDSILSTTSNPSFITHITRCGKVRKKKIKTVRRKT
jgi:hypothetical protein